MDKMNISDLAQDDTQQIFNSSQCYDEDLEAQTSELINEVFNTSYEPVYNPSETRAIEERYRHQKELENKKNKHKFSQYHKIYQNLEDKELPESFRDFLTRSQQKYSSHQHWVDKKQKQKLDSESRTLKEIPDILRGSREKIIPLYERCVELQKEKEKKMEQKRIVKHKTEAQKIQSITFKPTIKKTGKQRTFQEYLADKQTWKREKEEQLEKKRLKKEVSKLAECTFAPTLVAKYNKPNTKLIPGQKVEDRLLRSLQRSYQKNQHH